MTPRFTLKILGEPLPEHLSVALKEEQLDESVWGKRFCVVHAHEREVKGAFFYEGRNGAEGQTLILCEKCLASGVHDKNILKWWTLKEVRKGGL